MINYVKADNYRSFVNFKIDFSSVNLLLGSNGAGKSTLFTLLAQLRLFIQGKVDSPEAFPFDSLTRWQSVPVQSFEFSLSYKDYEYTYHLEIEFNHDEKKNRVSKEMVLCDDKPIFHAENGKATLYNDAHKEGPEVLMNWLSSGVSAVYERPDNKKLCSFRRAVNNIIVCHPMPLPLYSRSPFLESQYLDYYANNISDVYSSISQSNPEKLFNLWQILRDINPCFSRTFLKDDTEKILCLEYDHQGAKSSYTLEEISDGERMLFMLYFLITVYFDSDFSIFIDEPDNYISLREVSQFVQYVQDLAGDKKQCVLISHHPTVIDFFAPSNGIWLARRSYGATALSEPPKSESKLTYSEILTHGGADET